MASNASRRRLDLTGGGDFAVAARIGVLDPLRTNLFEVVNPFGLALQRGVDLKRELRSDPGSPIFDQLVHEVAQSIDQAKEAGFDGVLYRLHGADLRHCSPMEYGGHFLEVDRELLSRWPEGRHVVLVVAGEGAFLDFVSDLPGAVFAWDSEATGVDDAQMRTMRAGTLASADLRSEIEFTCATALVDQLEKQTCGSL